MKHKTVSRNPSQTIKPLLFLLGQGILWPAALLAVLGRLWRTQNDVPDLLAAVLLALVVELFVALTFPRRPESRRWPLYWLPILLLGFLFPVRALLLYLVTIAVLEGTRLLLPPFVVTQNGPMRILSWIRFRRFCLNTAKKIIKRFSVIAPQIIEIAWMRC